MARALIPAVVAALAIGWAAPATATSYGSRANPIKAENSSDAGNAWFYGAITLANRTQLKNAYYFRDSAPGGNAAYVTTDWYYWVSGCVGGGSCYDDFGSDRSSSTTSGLWIDERDYDDLEQSADRGRGATRVCEDQAWQWDDCSKYAIVTLTY